MSSNRKGFRILRGGNDGKTAPAEDLAMQATDDEPGAGGMVEGAVEHRPTLTPRQEIEQIKKENLTGRQLRIARRMAQRHNLSPTSDLDAVRLLRRQGIDPFGQKDQMGVLTPANPAPGEPQGGAQPVSLPATVRKQQVGKADKVAPPVIDDDTREREVRKIQRELVKRRRRRLGILMVKLAAFVGLPSLIAGYYFYVVATPMYATYTEFVIQKAESPSALGGTGGLLSGSPFETATDSITVQGYLTSRDAMIRLNENPGFKQYFSAGTVDVLQRLEPDATNEDVYKVYKKRVIIGFDPTEGVVKMEVIAPSPDASKQISEALIGYAEEQVDQLTARLREDQLAGARTAYEEAEAKMEAALEEVAVLQRRQKTLDQAAENTRILAQITELEGQELSKELELAQLEDNVRPNRTKLRVLKREIEILQSKIADLRKLISDGNGTEGSLIDNTADVRKAETNLALRQQLLAQALQNLETARLDANRQTRYLSMGVSPVTPDKATYPKAFENTLLSIVIFAGIYLMVSLTASILREQITS